MFSVLVIILFIYFCKRISSLNVKIFNELIIVAELLIVMFTEVMSFILGFRDVRKSEVILVEFGLSDFFCILLFLYFFLIVLILNVYKVEPKIVDVLSDFSLTSFETQCVKVA